MSGAREEFDGLMGLDGWRGFVDPWDRAEELGGSEFADWMRDGRGPTCLDCGRCEMMDGAMDEEVKAVLGYRIGFCLENFAWVTDQCTVDELGNDGDDGCFRWW